jgi:hypothetical protein
MAYRSPHNMAGVSTQPLALQFPASSGSRTSPSGFPTAEYDPLRCPFDEMTESLNQKIIAPLAGVLQEHMKTLGAKANRDESGSLPSYKELPHSAAKDSNLIRKKQIRDLVGYLEEHLQKAVECRDTERAKKYQDQIDQLNDEYESFF